MSSIVRKMYYDRCHGLTRYPRVVIGTPESWDPTISLSGKHDYGSCTWSPCGQFIAAQAGGTVEIRNPLTFELLTVLKSTKYTPLLTSPLAYSPGGRSLTYGFSGGIVIWDIQTGGVANEIRCDGIIASLVWSLDGSVVAVTFSSGDWITKVETYNVLSGVQLFTKRFKREAYIYLWAHEKSFRLIEVAYYFDNYTISEIGTTLIKIESSSLTIDGRLRMDIYEIAFSPSTYCLTAFGRGTSVFDIRTSRVLLQEPSSFTSFHLSPDGSHFACFQSTALQIFKYTSDRYTPFWESPFGHKNNSCLQFSPSSSSLLSQHDGILQVRRLSDLPSTSKSHRQYTAITRSGRRITTVNSLEATVTIIDLHSQAPSQFIDTGLDACRLAITGNVLVVMGTREAAGWLLTEEGTVDGVFDNQRASRSNSKWTLAVPPGCELVRWELRVEGKVGVIQGKRRLRGRYFDPLFYRIETGDVLELAPEPQLYSPEISTGGELHYRLAAPLYLIAS